jgi:hypothetical protein
MNSVKLYQTLFVLICLVACRAMADEPPSGIVLKDPVVYRIKMQTTLTVPADNHGIDRIRVWHALPTRRLWSRTLDDVGVTHIQASSGGVLQFKKRHRSYQNYWEIDQPQKPGQRYTFVSRYQVRSVERDFLPDAAGVSWVDYERPAEVPEAKVDLKQAGEIHPVLVGVADEIKQNLPPALAVYEFCKWINKTIAYEASVPYSTRDIEAILENSRGHCGHRTHVLRQLCARAGIPMRRVLGLNLNTPDGRGSLHEIKADYTNVHTWAEVYFPGVGWVEVEPANGMHPFRIPAQCIQNNTWFQNYSIWIRENDNEKHDTWTYENGKYTSDYGVENLITFTKRSE